MNGPRNLSVLGPIGVGVVGFSLGRDNGSHVRDSGWVSTTLILYCLAFFGDVVECLAYHDGKAGSDPEEGGFFRILGYSWHPV